MNTTAWRLLRGRCGLNVPSVYPVVTPTSAAPLDSLEGVVVSRHVREPLALSGPGMFLEPRPGASRRAVCRR